MPAPTYLSLFSGIGGLDLGLDRAGWSCAGQVELDPFCRTVLARHWPKVPRHDDVRTCPAWWQSTKRPPVDAVAGGFPCQGHSVAGHRRGTHDPRWGWPWFRDVSDALAPKLIIIENVPNLVRTGLADVLRDLADRGFDAWWGRIPAAAVGAPHLRWRLFVLAAHPERVDLRHQPGWSRGAGWAGTAVVGHDGATWALANTAGLGRDHRTGLRQGATGLGGPSWLDLTVAVNGGSVVADAQGERGELREATAERPTRSASRRAGADVAHADGEVPQERRPTWPTDHGGHWAVEPDVGRVVDGFPGRVDRLRALGNALVPQVAQHIGLLAHDLLGTGARG